MANSKVPIQKNSRSCIRTEERKSCFFTGKPISKGCIDQQIESADSSVSTEIQSSTDSESSEGDASPHYLQSIIQQEQIKSIKKGSINRSFFNKKNYLLIYSSS